MMKVERKDNEKKTVFFEDLEVGDVYRDSDGFICIKVSAKEDNAECNALTCGWIEENHWEPTWETYGTEVTPLNATLTVWE